MDRAYRIPFTGIRFGWDAMFGLVPGIGDTLALAPALWIVKEAHGMGAPKVLLGQMGANLATDWVAGLIPLVGDVFDIGFRANTRNAALLRRWLESRQATPGSAPAVTPDRPIDAAA
ncbi:DUF4112 domain-containing protein [Salipiger mangrovisoli]|uniref:DUF4112 domain-containing protein n=1 Tax=Salipiger mangrovisoli TaxID=2865933 RepID=A0ABR9WWN5_9RHOB|nr:DUF4112 domain-containing protein [Salipiger mangrovisoli]MBE9635697.1 DUF4112 domain-containing protein [Salipiger mangrovisoli]